MNVSQYLEVFFDTEFTHFQDTNVEETIQAPIPIYQQPKAQLISIGFASECGKTFYAENADLDYSLCSEFVIEHVLPKLEGGDVSMSLANMAKQITDFINSFEVSVMLISDAPNYDWSFLEHLFKQYGYPDNLRQINGPSDASHVIEKMLREMGKPVAEHPKRYGANSIFFIEVNQKVRFLSKLKQLQSASGFRHHHALDDAVANMQAYLFSQA